MNRILKQILYGIFYISILSGFFWIGYNTVFAPEPTCSDNVQNQGEEAIDCGGPCTACDIVNLRPLQEVGSAREFTLNNRHSALITVSNVNQSHDARFNYRLEFLDESGLLIDEIYGSSYVFASDRDYIHRTIDRDFASVELKIIDTDWVQDSELEKPSIENPTIGFDGEEVRISGVVNNSSSGQFSNVRIIAVFRDSLGFSEIFSAQIVVDSIGPFGEREFSVSVPVADELQNEVDLEETELLLSIDD